MVDKVCVLVQVVDEVFVLVLVEVVVETPATDTPETPVIVILDWVLFARDAVIV